MLVLVPYLLQFLFDFILMVLLGKNILIEHDISYKSQSAAKSQVLADFIIE